MPHDRFKGHTHKYILTGIDVASRYKVARPLKSKKPSELALELVAIYKKGDVFKYPKVFQCDNGSEFKGEVTKLLKNTMLRPGGQQRSISTPIQPSLRLLIKS